jgi:hypothetical protein
MLQTLSTGRYVAAYRSDALAFFPKISLKHMTCQATVLLRAFGYRFMTLAPNATISANEVHGLRYFPVVPHAPFAIA